MLGPSQTGVAPLQSAAARQPTQVAAAVSQTGTAPVQAVLLPAEHWPQAPLAWQAGVAPLQFASLPQGWQTWETPLQTGVVPAQWLPLVQPTHCPLPTSQTGVAPWQATALAAEHWPQAPLGWQAAAAPPHSPSTPQPRQVFIARSQNGVAPEQSALIKQPTHCLTVVSHTGKAPPQVLLLTQATH